MNRLTTLSILAMGLAVPLEAVGGPVRVHVIARTANPVDGSAGKAAEKDAEAARKAAEQARESVEKSLSSRHGKRHEDWPSDAKAVLDEAWRKEMDAVIAHEALKTNAKGHADSVKDLTRAFTEERKRAPHVTLVDSADQADLTIEVLARRGKVSIPIATHIYYVKVTPRGSWGGDGLVGQTFGQVGEKDAIGNARVQAGVVTVHPYSEAEPFWILEVFQKGPSFYATALTLAESVADFTARF